MFNLTPQEHSALLLLAASLLMGGLVSVYKQYRSDFAPDLVSSPWLSGASPAVAAADTGAGAESPSQTERTAHQPASDSLQPSPPSRPGRRSSKHRLPTAPLNLNTASAAELQTLPGIGPTLAARIVAYRTQRGRFHSVEQLRQVKGIGRVTLAKLKPWVRVN